MRKLFFVLSLLIVTLTISAVPAKPGLWKTITLSNGTEVRAQLVGDEHGHWMQAADGTCYVMKDGVYEQVDRQVLVQKRQARMNMKAAKRKAIYASTSDGLGEKGTMSRGAVQSIGEYTIPVVMVQFSDLKFKSTTTVEKMNRYYNEEGYHDETGCVGSVRDYFKAQSGGQFVPTFEVVGIVTLDNGYAYYGANNSDGDDQNLDQLPGDVISKAVSTLGADFSKYVIPAGDEYHKAGVPLLAMFYAGKGEATEEETTANSKYLWPCEWDDVEDAENGDYNNVHFNSFFIGNELIGSKLMGMSVFCHEFGHALGLPDFYCTDYSYKNDDPFGLWSIMDSGAYVDDECRAPVGYNAYEKSYMGWLELKEIGDADEVTLQSPEGKAENSAYIIRNSNTETFIFENRQPGTWYPEDFGSGVMVSRIAYSYNSWKGNTLNNTQSKKRACVLTADGQKNYYTAYPSNLYGNAKTSIGSLKTYGGSTKDMKITKVTKNTDGTITLTLNGSSSGGDGETGDGAFEKVTAASQLVVGNDYVLISTDKQKGAGAYNTKYFDAIDVTISGNTASGNDLTVMTLGGATGAYSLKLADGTFLTTTAAKNLSKTSTEAKVWNITSTDDGYVVAAANSDYGIIKYNYASNANRFMNYAASSTTGMAPAILYVKKTTTGIQGIQTVTRPADGKIYSIDGRYVGTDFSVLKHGIYIVNGKKVVK